MSITTSKKLHETARKVVSEVDGEEKFSKHRGKWSHNLDENEAGWRVPPTSAGYSTRDVPRDESNPVLVALAIR